MLVLGFVVFPFLFSKKVYDTIWYLCLKNIAVKYILSAAADEKFILYCNIQLLLFLVRFKF